MRNREGGMDVRACACMQITNPPRSSGRDITELHEYIVQLVSNINRTYGTPTYQPVHYLERHVPLHERMAFYAVSDCALVTATRDGRLRRRWRCARRALATLHSRAGHHSGQRGWAAGRAGKLGRAGKPRTGMRHALWKAGSALHCMWSWARMRMSLHACMHACRHEPGAVRIRGVPARARHGQRRAPRQHAGGVRCGMPGGQEPGAGRGGAGPIIRGMTKAGVHVRAQAASINSMFRPCAEGSGVCGVCRVCGVLAIAERRHPRQPVERGERGGRHLLSHPGAAAAPAPQRGAVCAEVQIPWTHVPVCGALEAQQAAPLPPAMPAAAAVGFVRLLLLRRRWLHSVCRGCCAWVSGG